MSNLTPEQKLTYLYERERRRQKVWWFKGFIKLIFYWIIIWAVLYAYYVILPKLTPEYMYWTVKTVVEDVIEEKSSSIWNNLKNTWTNLKDKASDRIKKFMDSY